MASNRRHGCVEGLFLGSLPSIGFGTTSKKKLRSIRKSLAQQRVARDGTDTAGEFFGSKNLYLTPGVRLKQGTSQKLRRQADADAWIERVKARKKP